jgi:Mrp family chromosome partitioning ATPase
VIENMSGMKCPHCGKEIDLFKTGGGERAALQLGVPFLGRVPFEPQIVEFVLNTIWKWYSRLRLLPMSV